MNDALAKIIVATSLGIFSLSASAQSTLHHDVNVTLFPTENRLAVSDIITLPIGIAASTGVEFDLNAQLQLSSLVGQGYSIVALDKEGETATEDGRDLAASTR